MNRVFFLCPLIKDLHTMPCTNWKRTEQTR